jgi:hypothetical protein
MRRGGLAALPTVVLAFVAAAAPPSATAAPRPSTERVTIESDGWRLAGDLVFPDSARPVPAVVLIHGAAGDRGAYVKLADALAAKGIGSPRIDLQGLPFLMIVSRNERYLKELAAALRDRSRTAEFLEVGGTEHAADLLAARPDLVPLIAVWFREKLAGDPTGARPSKPAD